MTGVEPTQAKRMVHLFDARIAGPVASMWAQALFGVPAPGMSGTPRSSLEQQPPTRGVRFVVSRTEDAMDSVIPCAAEELLRPMIQSKFADAAKMQFRYC
jgi:hypothetical protein